MLTLGSQARLATIFGCCAMTTMLAASNAQAEGMIGSWNMTVKVDQKAAEKALAEANEQERALLTQLLPAMKATTGTLDIREDGSYTFKIKVTFFGKTQEQVEEGSWKLVKRNGKDIVVETTEKGKTKSDTHTITQIDKDHFVESAPKEMGPLADALKMHFKRKN